MKYVSCPICGSRLFEGEEGSHVIIKCVKCNKLFESLIHKEKIEILVKEKTQKVIK